MKFNKTARRRVALVAASSAGALIFAGCSAGSLGSSDAGGQAGATTISFLTGNTDTEVAGAKAVIEAFQAANPNIKITHETRPGGSEGDNLVKRGWPPVRCPTSSSTTTAHCCRRSSRSRTSPPWTTSHGRGNSMSCSRHRARAPTESCMGVRGVPPSVAESCATGRSTRSSASRCPKRGMSSWPTTRRSRRQAESPRSSRPTGRPGRLSCSCSATSTTFGCGA
jgi:hypothetical protein